MKRKGSRRLRPVAVFDIDGTIFRSSLLIELVEELVDARVFPQRARAVYERARMQWLDRKGSYEKYVMAVVGAYLRYIRGVREKDFVRVVRHVTALHRNRVYRYTRGLIRSLKRRGYFLLAISHSPKYIVDAVAKRWGFNKCYGVILELDERSGHFTGRRLHADVIWDKAKVLRRAAEKERLTMRNSVGVGDTESDIPFLRLVDRPLCFNPNAALYRAAKRHHWPVVVERKDVIYTIKT